MLYIGIGTTNPTEKLEVNGIVYSNTGGIKFPDNTIQQTAAFSSYVKDASDDRLFIVMELEIDGSQINGPYNDNIYTNAFKINDWNMNFERPFDGSGQVQKSPFTIIKNIDDGSPEIMMGLFTNKECMFTLHLLYDNHGTMEEIYRVILADAKIFKTENILVYKGNYTFAQLETVSFEPFAGNVKHIPSGKIFSFNFTSPN